MLDCPDWIDDGVAVGAATDGGVHGGGLTVTVTVRLSTDVLQPLTRTQ